VKKNKETWSKIEEKQWNTMHKRKKTRKKYDKEWKNTRKHYEKKTRKNNEK
jgi:hypothetical protein